MDIAWGPIVGLRNRLIHGYDTVDLTIVWAVLVADLPELVESLEAILEADDALGWATLSGQSFARSQPSGHRFVSDDLDWSAAGLILSPEIGAVGNAQVTPREEAPSWQSRHLTRRRQRRLLAS